VSRTKTISMNLAMMMNSEIMMKTKMAGWTASIQFLTWRSRLTFISTGYIAVHWTFLVSIIVSYKSFDVSWSFTQIASLTASSRLNPYCKLSSICINIVQSSEHNVDRWTCCAGTKKDLLEDLDDCTCNFTWLWCRSVLPLICSRQYDCWVLPFNW
jgi:hypothetical protein